MKLTESKLKKLIFEMMSEKREMAKKIFSMIKNHNRFQDESTKASYDQAVMLTAGADLLEEVLEIYNEYIGDQMLQPEMYAGPHGFGYGDVMRDVYNSLTDDRNKFAEDVRKEMRQ